jgi:hypothetical protein
MQGHYTVNGFPGQNPEIIIHTVKPETLAQQQVERNKGDVAIFN